LISACRAVLKLGAPAELHKLGCFLGLHDDLGGSGFIPNDDVFSGRYLDLGAPRRYLL
jgi:hypothetical protein